MNSPPPPGKKQIRRISPKADGAVATSSEEGTVLEQPGSDDEEPTSVDRAPSSIEPPVDEVTEMSESPDTNAFTDPDVGQIISARYRLEKVLGEGGMGKVFLAIDELYEGEFQDRQAQVAIKFLGKKFANHSVSRVALQRETRKSQQLSHPNVVRVMHFDLHNGHPYMIMEYMRGQPLDEFIASNAAGEKPLVEVFNLIEGMALGLEYIHNQGLIHSDFKPNNVFVGADGLAKILDLGIARIKTEDAENTPETYFDVSSLGALTPSYASCEMFEGQNPDVRDDIYALACVTYELLGGKHPFDRTPALKARADGMKPRRLKQLGRSRWQTLEQALSFSRQERTGSAADFLEGLRGEKSRSRMVLGLLSTIALLAIVSAIIVGLVAVKPEDEDKLFMDRLSGMSGNATAPTEVDNKRIVGWLEQGQAYLKIAREVFEQGDMLSAHQILVEGADNAQAAFTFVLQRVDSAEAREGMLEMVNLYAQWTQSKMNAGNATHALWAACHGLAIHPKHTALLELADEARSAMPDAANTECAYMRSLTP